MQYNETTIAIFDGTSFILYDFDSAKWTEGPSKYRKNYDSGCALFYYGTKSYILVGHAAANGSTISHSAEINILNFHNLGYF